MPADSESRITRLDAKQAAELLGVSKDTIYNMVKANEIPHFKVRRRVFFVQEKIEEWILKQHEDFFK